MRDAHRPAPCPVCESSNTSVLHATQAVLYVSCRRCDHVWHVALHPVDPLRRRTSAAFRMTTRIAGRGTPAALAG